MYTFVKYLVRCGLLIFCRKIIFTNKSVLEEKGPLLLACNHPNSFFDALILGAYFKHPVHFLARGDAFKNPIAKKLLTALKAIPIYRLKEGKEYLALNDYTFERCLQILKEGGIVLIFSEGLCVNQWQLRPLKKGTARIALNVWKLPGINNDFRVLPVTFNYSSFNHFNKSLIVNFGRLILRDDLPEDRNEGEQIVVFNKLLHSRLEEGMLVQKTDAAVIEFLITNSNLFRKKISETIPTLIKLQEAILNKKLDTSLSLLKGTKKITFHTAYLSINILAVLILFIPALAVLLVHLPLYLPLNNYIRNKTKGTVFYHSALFGSLIIIYPVYVLIVSAGAIIIFGFPALLLILAMPLLALIYLYWKDCVESTINYFTLSDTERREVEQLAK